MEKKKNKEKNMEDELMKELRDRISDEEFKQIIAMTCLTQEFIEENGMKDVFKQFLIEKQFLKNENGQEQKQDKQKEVRHNYYG